MISSKPVKPMDVLIILALTLSSALAGAQEECVPKAHSCDYYACAENQNPCGSSGYILNFGARNCPKYLTAERELSKALRKMMPKVRLCLQEELEAIVSDTPHDKNFCSAIEIAAFQSHVPCYLESGYCDLTTFEQWKILQLTGFSILHPLSVQAGLQIQAGCLRKSSHE